MMPRQAEMDALDQTLSEARDWVKGVLNDIGWTQEHLLQKVRDWSSITGKRVSYKMGGGLWWQVKFYPYKERGGGGVLARLKEWHTKF